MKRVSKAVEKKRERNNKIKRLYATFRENVVVVVVFMALITSATVFLLINTGSKSVVKMSTSNKEDKVYETKIDQRFAISNIKTLNPIVSTDRDTYYLSKLLYNSLFSYDNNFGLKEDLVDTYNVDSGNGTVDIKLKSGVKFHNGESLNSSDVKFTVDSIIGDGSNGLYSNIAKKIDSVSGSDLNLTIKFKNPKDAALSNLTFPIMCESEYGTDASYRPIGTGQYKVSSQNLKKQIVLKPNEAYFGTVAKNNLNFQIYGQSQTYELVASYDITALMYDKFDGNSIAEDKKIGDVPIVSNNMEYMGFNFNNSLLKLKKFRQAIAYAIDMNKLVDSSYQNIGEPADSIYFPGYLGVENKGDAYPYDFAKAEKLIKELNLSDSNGDGYLDDGNDKAFKIRILVNENDLNRCVAAEKIKYYLEGILINSEVVKEDWEKYLKDLKGNNFDIVLGGYSVNKNDNLSMLFDKNNYIKYNNAHLLNEVNNLNSLMKIEDYKKAYTQLKKDLNEDLPYYCICYKNYTLLGVNDSKYDVYPTYDNIYGGVSTWSYEQEVRESEESD